MRYASIRSMDISNGDGIRVSLFVQGCSFHCKGCFNKETWDFCGGKEWEREVENRFIDLCKQPHITGISILGGEPLQQDSDLLNLLKRIKDEVMKPVMLWTGYDIHNIPKDKQKMINDYISILVTGQFIESLKDLSLKYRGSSNQEIWKINKIDSVWIKVD